MLLMVNPLSPVDKTDTVNVLKFLTLYSILFWPTNFVFMQFFLKILSGMVNSADPIQTARSSLIWV